MTTPNVTVEIESETLKQIAAEVTSLGYLSAALLYSLIVGLALLFPVPWDNYYTIGLTLTVAILAWCGWIWLQYHPITPARAHLALFLMIALMAIQTGAVLFEIADPMHTGNQALVLLCVAFFVTERFWFYTSAAVTVGCWLPAAIVGLNNEQVSADWNQWSRMLLVTMVLAIAYFEARRRSVLKTHQLRLAAEAALATAQLANQSRLDMQHMMQEAQRREALGVLAGGIAHDFNNLLTVISGNLELMLTATNNNSNHDPSDHDRTSMLAEMDKACDRAIELTQQMLVYAGRSKPKIGSLNLGQRIRSAARLMESSTPANVVIQLDGAEDGPEIAVDSTLLDQLIINVIQNAIEACEQSGGQVRLNWGQVELDTPALARLHFYNPPKPGHYAQIIVSDNGIGMDTQTRNRMFEPFYSTKAKGNGLGLAVATGILESHNAGVHVESTPGQGTELRLAIPMPKNSQVLGAVTCAN